VVSLSERPESVHGPSAGKRLRWRLAGTVLITAGLAAMSLWPSLRDNAVIGVINLLVAVSFMATGIILGDEPAQRSTARALKLAAIFYLVPGGGPGRGTGR
jgi:hypothetical protein